MDYQQEQELYTLASKIRELWVREHRAFELRTTGRASDFWSRPIPRYDGGVDSRGIHHTNKWEKIAEFVRQRDIDPQTLVYAMFFRESIAPKPTQAFGPHAEKKYELYVSPMTLAEIRADIKNGFESEKSQTGSNIKRLVHYGGKPEELALRQTVLSRSNTLSNLFRYCVLKNMGREVADDYEDAAYHQYSRHKDIYDEVMGDWIPQHLRDRFQKKQGASR